MDYNQIPKSFIIRIIKSKRPFYIRNPFLSGITKLVLIPDILFIIFCFLRYSHAELFLLFGLASNAVLINLAPFLHWYYCCKLLPEFLKTASSQITNRETLIYSFKKSNNVIRKTFWFFAAICIGLISGVWLFSAEILKQWGFFGFSDPWYWVTLICIAWVFLIMSYVFYHSIISTNIIIGYILNKKIFLDPFNTDNLGGLGCFGYLSIRTTTVVSAGALILPLAFQMTSRSDRLLPLLYVFLSLYLIFILFTFFFPTIRVNLKAKKEQSIILNNFRIKYNDLINSKKGSNNLHYYLRLNQIRDRYLDYKSIRLYPFNIEILSRLITLIIIPIALLLMQRFWFY